MERRGGSDIPRKRCTEPRSHQRRKGSEDSHTQGSLARARGWRRKLEKQEDISLRQGSRVAVQSALAAVPKGRNEASGAGLVGFKSGFCRLLMM